MTKRQLITKLIELDKLSNSDPEIAHCDADEALLEFINDTEVTEKFNGIRKWYA